MSYNFVIHTSYTLIQSTHTYTYKLYCIYKKRYSVAFFFSSFFQKKKNKLKLQLIRLLHNKILELRFFLFFFFSSFWLKIFVFALLHLTNILLGFCFFFGLLAFFFFVIFLSFLWFFLQFSINFMRVYVLFLVTSDWVFKDWQTVSH